MPEPAVHYRNGCFLRPAGQAEFDPPAPELLAAGGRVVACGSGLSAPAGAEVVDLEGRAAIPGLVDAHCHLVSYGLDLLLEADLRGCRSLNEIGRRLGEHARRLGLAVGDGRWLLGRGFDQELLPGGRWPSAADLDSIEGLPAAIPVRITRVCGHALVANGSALRAAGLAEASESGNDPPGLLTEERMGPLLAAEPSPSPDEWLEAAREATRAAVRAGFTGIHSLMANAHEIRALQRLHSEEGLPLRVEMQLPFSLLRQAVSAGLRSGFGDERLTYGAVKLFSDGSMGARTAALRSPYEDDPSTSGELIYEPDHLRELVQQVKDGGFGVCIHAIGDRAMDVTLDAIEAALAGGPWLPPPRIEHASMVDEGLIRRMKTLNVGAAVQPQFAWSDRWTPERVGAARAAGCYAFRDMWQAGLNLAGSTDCPVEKLDAMAALGQMVHRPPWLPGQEIPLAAAIRIFSEGSFALRGLAPALGSLRDGGYADFVVLDRDPRSVQPEEIEQLRVVGLVTGGRQVYRL